MNIKDVFRKRIKRYLLESEDELRDLIRKIEELKVPITFKESNKSKIVVLLPDKERIDWLQSNAAKLGGTYFKKGEVSGANSSAGVIVVNIGKKNIKIEAKPLKGQSTVDSNIDDLREVSVLLMLDFILYKGIDSVKEAELLLQENYTSSRIKSTISLDSVRSYLLEFPKKISVAYKNAKNIIDNTTFMEEILSTKENKVVIDLTEYTFHHKDSVYNAIMSTGKKLSGLSVDKWNPADVLLIRGAPKTTFKDIIDLNSYVNSANCLSISLKEGETTARHGKFAVNNIYKKFDSLSYTKKSLYEKFKLAFKNRNNTGLKIYAPKEVGPVITEEIFNSIVDDNNNLKKSLDTQLDLWGQVDSSTFREVILYAVAGCTSELPTSSSFFKIDDSHCQYYDVKNNKRKIDILEVLHTLGETQVVTKIVYDDKPIKLQCRTFGAPSQFEAIVADYKVQEGKVVEVKEVR